MTPTLVVWLWVPLLSSAGFSLVAPVVARRLEPRTATWLLSAGGCLLAASTVALPALVLSTAIGQWHPIASLGHWAPSALRGR